MAAMVAGWMSRGGVTPDALLDSTDGACHVWVGVARRQKDAAVCRKAWHVLPLWLSQQERRAHSERSVANGWFMVGLARLGW